MNEVPGSSSPSFTTTELREKPRLVAPLWHTAILVAVLLALAAYGASAQRHASGPELVSHRGSALPLYASLLVAQWALLRFVVVGLRKRGARLRDLIGERWRNGKDVARDVGIAFLVWAGWTLAELAVGRMLGPDTAKNLGSLLPRGAPEIFVWILLSLTAGFCEESIFRGYLQRQFQALTGSAAVAVALQALVFGVSHGYQGLRNVVAITVFGALFGALAAWRRSLKPGMVLHAWTDIFGGLIARG